jgi:hypothetical protein
MRCARKGERDKIMACSLYMFCNTCCGVGEDHTPVSLAPVSPGEERGKEHSREQYPRSSVRRRAHKEISIERMLGRTPETYTGLKSCVEEMVHNGFIVQLVRRRPGKDGRQHFTG